MATKLPLKCRCGAMRGTANDVAPEAGNRIVCLCDDCQTYAAYVGSLGGDGRIVDAYGAPTSSR
jgi:hypothetical protein